MSTETIYIHDLTFSDDDVSDANAPISASLKTTFVGKAANNQKYVVTFIKDGLGEVSNIWMYMYSILKLDSEAILPIIGFSHPETSDFKFPSVIQKDLGLPTLLDLISSGDRQLSAEQKRACAISTASAVVFFHTSKLVHGNLYLNNILIKEDGTSFVTGFGVPYAQMQVSNKRPEIFNNPESAPSEEGDIFELGLIIKALLTWEIPTDTTIPENATESMKILLADCFHENKKMRISDDALITSLFSNKVLFGDDDFSNLDRLKSYARKTCNISTSIPPSKIRFIHLCRFAEHGNLQAMNKVGILLEKGIDCEKDDAKALQFFQQASEKGFIEAMINLGRIYNQGTSRFAGHDDSLAITYYERAGAIAEMNLGDLNLRKLGGEALFQAAEIINSRSPFDDLSEEALAFYERSAFLGNSNSALKVGRFLFRHVNNPVQRKRAGEFLRRAAEAGSAPAQNEYAKYLEKVIKEEESALKFYIMAADQGNELSMYNAGRILLKGREDPGKIAQGVEYIRLSAEKNYSLATLKLGELLLSGRLVEKNAEEGFIKIKAAAELKNPQAINILGECYLFGTGCQQNIIEAKKYFEQAANLRVPRGCTNYGHMLIQKGAPFYKEAFAVYRLAAELNDPIGMICCGQLLESGFGGVEDPHYSQAAAYYQRAAATGNSYAYSNLGRLYQNGTGLPQDSARSVKMFKRSIQLGNTNAMYNLGAMYENGAGVPQSQSDAYKYYNMAAEKGNPQALLKVASILDATGATEDRVRAAKMKRLAEVKMRILSEIPSDLTLDEAMGPFAE